MRVDLEQGKDDAYCYVSGCFNVRKKSIYCGGHAAQERAGKSFSPLKRQHHDKWAYPRCSFDGCERPECTGGLCSSHHSQRRNGRPLTVLRVYAWAEDGVCVHPSCRRGRVQQGYCEEHAVSYASNTLHDPRVECAISGCTGLIRLALSQSGLCKKHVGAARRFGVTPQAIFVLFQDYVCAICGVRPGMGKLHIDHDHSCCKLATSGSPACGNCVRGLLCMHCNHMIGNAKEDESILFEAIAYLRRTRELGLDLVA